MIGFSSPAAAPQEIENRLMHAQSSAILHSIRGRRTLLLGKAAVFLISIQILCSMVCLHEARAQEVTDREISELAQRLEETETELESIDRELSELKEKYRAVTSEKNRLTRELIEDEAKPKNFMDRIGGIFAYRKRGRIAKLMTESKYLADRISALTSMKREPLVEHLAKLADELIDKSTSRMTDLMEIVNQANQESDLAARNAAWQRVSALWKLAEEAGDAKSEYAPDAPNQEQVKDLPSLLSDDPDDLRLGAAILKDWAVDAQGEAARLEAEIEKLRRRTLLMKRMIEVSEKIQRSDEERGATGVGTAQTPWSGDDKSGIDDIEEKINELMGLKRQHEADAERFENQSKALEQRASQMEAELKGKSEDD